MQIHYKPLVKLFCICTNLHKSQAPLSQSTSMLCNYIQKCFRNKTQKHSRDPHIICQAAVSKPLHLAKTCLKDSQASKKYEGTQKEAE